MCLVNSSLCFDCLVLRFKGLVTNDITVSVHNRDWCLTISNDFSVAFSNRFLTFSFKDLSVSFRYLVEVSFSFSCFSFFLSKRCESCFEFSFSRFKSFFSRSQLRLCFSKTRRGIFQVRQVVLSRFEGCLCTCKFCFSSFNSSGFSCGDSFSVFKSGLVLVAFSFSCFKRLFCFSKFSFRIFKSLCFSLDVCVQVSNGFISGFQCFISRFKRLCFSVKVCLSVSCTKWCCLISRKKGFSFRNVSCCHRIIFSRLVLNQLNGIVSGFSFVVSGCRASLVCQDFSTIVWVGKSNVISVSF